ncbi:MAG: PAS domain-containing protein [Nitrospirae bacterium]|nr:PAS domain-containing protein [Nitrospirota bacterium]
MEILALLSRESLTAQHIKSALKGYTIYTLKTLEEFEDLSINIPINLLIVDTLSHPLSELGNLLHRLEHDMVILIADENPDKFSLSSRPQSVYGCVNAESIQRGLQAMVEHAFEKQRLRRMTEVLKRSRDDAYISAGGHTITDRAEETASLDLGTYPSERFQQKKVLVNFTKMLTFGFDMRKLFSNFMDSVSDIAHVNRMSIMLRDKEGFQVRECYGIDPYIVNNIKLGKESALVTWLAKNGRIRHKPLHPTDALGMDIKSEMELLQCTFSFPIIYKGKLIGIFNIDNKITGEHFHKDDLEIIFVLCNYLAAAVKDIDLYNQVLFQKEFTRNILGSMTSGVIAIGQDGKITVFNQQASEILNLKPQEVIGQGIKSLPPSLGEILYETMEKGLLYKRHEVEIGEDKLPVGVNSYRLLDENQLPAGAGIVFNDLTESRKLDAEKRKSEELASINELMAKVAHEIRNPMTSIYTYTQLISEKFKDDSLSDFYTTAVLHSIQKLDSLIDKLLIFSSEHIYSFNEESLEPLLNESADYIKKNLPPTHKFLKQGLSNPVFIKADKRLLSKALSYLVLSIIDRTPLGAFITLETDTLKEDAAFMEIAIKYNGDDFAGNSGGSVYRSVLNIDNLGAALNIPISNKIIEAHGGSITIKSENGNNTFMVKLPLSVEKGELDSERQRESSRY